MSLTPTSLTPTADPAVFLVPEDYQAGTLAVLVEGVFQQPGVVYDAAGDGNRTVTFGVAPSGWVAGTWATVPGLGTGHYLTTDLLQARVGGSDIYLQLTDDDGDGTADPRVEEFLLSQVDAIADGFARRGGYVVPLASSDLEPVIPYLLEIANYKAKTRGNRTASDDDRENQKAAMEIMKQIAAGDFKLPSFETAAPIAEFGLDSSGDSLGTGPLYSRESLRGF